MFTWSRYGSGAFQYTGLRWSSVWSPRTYSLSTNGPAPTGWTLKSSGPCLLIAVGDAMNGKALAITRGNWPLTALSVIRSVLASTGFMSLMANADERVGAALLTSWSRAQLNFTALASSGVLSENFTFGRRCR